MGFDVPCVRADELLRFLSGRARARRELSPSAISLAGRGPHPFGCGARDPAMGVARPVAPRRRARLGGLGGPLRRARRPRAPAVPPADLVLARLRPGAALRLLDA